MIHSSHNTSSTALRQFKGQYPKLFVTQLAEGVFLMENNGLSLALAMKLQKSFGGMIDVYVVERLLDAYVPEKVKKVAEYLDAHRRGVTLQNAIKNSGFSVEEIEWQKIESRIVSKEK
jgi:hypothetical protein